ncbi:putative oxygen-dependent coproporphyrinogen-III oxidase, chloroplastic [Iris pallida]|uniref:coproporphyrinogen oxidase n=1 Tax=Iris pallida TaxID=29817 RepID=A0AAX6G1V3_IRIPA|nr:putative oxygen-dependent coproporphyrinogen-III oxidase, chloroplastic [Iris pallida]
MSLSISSSSSLSPLLFPPPKTLTLKPLTLTLDHSASRQNPRLRLRLRRAAVRSAVAIEKEVPEAERPDTFLRSSDDSSHSSSVRSRFEKMIRAAQDEVCAAIEAADGGGRFQEDVWSRPGGGGGISRVLQDGGVWEKAGVNVSVVYGMMPPEAYRAAKGVKDSSEKAGPVPFFAAGISSVLHPKNPFAPTLHFNYRYFETDAPKDAPGAPRQWWFGGGTDLTPAYIFEEDVKHFHEVQKQACDKFDPSFYPRFKKWCDDYFSSRIVEKGVGLVGYFSMTLMIMIKKCFSASQLSVPSLLCRHTYQS